MTARLRLLQVCEQSFDRLDGDDVLRRRCRRCDVAVHNYDLLPQRERDELLRRSDQERTACVGTAMPVAAAPSCRAGPAEDEAQPFTQAVAIREEMVLAPQWWRVLSLPTPAVVAAIHELAGDYGLRDHSHAGAAG
ncbi:hypothetical protein OV203_47015 [Nannocystis sp. ILAH1]|uniref:hypothetical protein n=1 Tax=Nannocystis sp. ILAH1 TaxID=2996789 RepID=UPI002271F859|nr:hypothetical protein [Nannocystis sp. ILAH1]MCY0994768.1 hypothetical protein [Nannocystis sp. ILAH1]